MKFVVRRARREDVSAIVALERGIAEAAHWSEAVYAAMVSVPSSGVRRLVVVAESVSDELVGFAGGRVVASVGELESVAVDVNARRGGVGRALCEAVIGWCREQGAHAVELEVRAGSVGAQTLYRGLGFREVGIRPGYYRDPADDAVLMRMELGSPDRE